MYFDKLPKICYSVLETTNELIIIKSGEKGYYPQRPDNEPWGAENCDMLNERLGVSKAQVKAMEAGSMFGWDVPASNPDNYNADGEYIPIHSTKRQ